MCGGELLYQRLDERMFLTCVDSQKNLVFAFRTLDRRFDLYLPAQNTIYYGSIFDMEDSPDIESHLKPRDLYRALKPMAIDMRHTEIERNNAVVISLDVYGKKNDGEYLLRKLYLTPEGDVRGELYFNITGRPVTEIQRFDFQEIPARVGSFHSIIFPKKITILSPETKKGSAIFFAKVQAMDSIDPLEFLLRVPEGTKEVFLDEKDPKFSMRWLTKSGKSVLTKKVVVSSQEEKSLRKDSAAPAKTASLPSEKSSEEKQVPDDADGVIAGQSSQDKEILTTTPEPMVKPLSDENPNTSLDPSVEPSADLEPLPEAEGPIVQYPKQPLEENQGKQTKTASKNS